MNPYIRINQAAIRRDRNRRMLQTLAWAVVIMGLFCGAGYVTTYVILKEQQAIGDKL